MRESQDRMDYIEKQLNLLTSEIKDKIKAMSEEVERKVGMCKAFWVRVTQTQAILSCMKCQSKYPMN